LNNCVYNLNKKKYYRIDMLENQLFQKKVPLEVVNRLCNCFGLEGLEDYNTVFNYQSLKYYKTYEKINEMKEELKEYYLPCKSYYLDLTRLENKKEFECVSILRHFLAEYDKSLFIKKMVKINAFFNLYSITNNNTKLINIKKKNIIIDFS